MSNVGLTTNPTLLGSILTTAESTTESALFFAFSCILIDECTELLRKLFLQRWDEQYANHVVETTTKIESVDGVEAVVGRVDYAWGSLSPSERGRLCWLGSDCNLPTSGRVISRDKGKLRVSEDMSAVVHDKDLIQLRLVDGTEVSSPLTVTSIAPKKIAFAEGNLELDPTQIKGSVVCIARVKSFKLKSEKKMRRAFEKKIMPKIDDTSTSGDLVATWDISLLSALLVNSNHGLLHSEEEEKLVNSIRNTRNSAVAHVSTCKMTAPEFRNNFNTLVAFCSTFFDESTNVGFLQKCRDLLCDISGRGEVDDTERGKFVLKWRDEILMRARETN